MSLTGGGPTALLILMSVLAFALVVWRWPGRRGGPVRRIGTRIVVLVALNALLLSTIAVGINAHYLLYANWTDLGNTFLQQQTATLVSRGQSASAAARTVVQGARSRPSGPGPTPLPAGTRTYQVHGTRSDITAPVIVNLPPGYAAGVRAGHRYPVLETFGGYPSSPAQWLKSMQLRQNLDAGVAAGRLAQAIIVSPTVEIPNQTDTECVDGGSRGPAVETWVADDVPAWVQQTFSVSDARSSWATIGLSAGAWCAAMTTMLHPQQFSAAIVMGGYLRPDFGNTYVPFTAGSAAGRRYDLVKTARRRAPPVALWLQTSAADPLSYPSSSELIRQARPPLSVTAVVLPDAGHRISVWKHLLPQAVRWLGTGIPGFAAVPTVATRTPGVAASSVRAIKA